MAYYLYHYRECLSFSDGNLALFLKNEVDITPNVVQLEVSLSSIGCRFHSQCLYEIDDLPDFRSKVSNRATRGISAASHRIPLISPWSSCCHVSDCRYGVIESFPKWNVG